MILCTNSLPNTPFGSESRIAIPSIPSGTSLGRGCSEMGSDTELDNTAGQFFHRALGFDEGPKLITYRMPIAPD